MYQSTKRAVFILMAGILLLAACAPAAPVPTQDPAEVEQQIQEAVILTVAAQNAQQTQAAAALPTNTPLPTQTEAGPATATPLIPTATPFVVVPPTTAPSLGGGGGGGTTTKPEYSCDVIRQRPFDDTYYKPGAPFDVKWTIVNTGTKAWAAGLDLKYSNGPKMTGSSLFELPAMKPGDQYAVDFDAVAPNEEGYQVMVWVLEGGICFPYVRIIVEK